ncbi:MAG TPA: hypothetical protein VF244_09900 [Acidimicrobiales bacterium]
MKRVALILFGMAALAVFVDVLGDLTQDRPDTVVRGAHSEIVLELRTKDYLGSPLSAAQGLWGACSGTVRQQLVAPGVVDLGAGRYLLVTDTAVGEHSWRRLQGCLEDATIDRVTAEVVTKRDLLPAGATG